MSLVRYISLALLAGLAVPAAMFAADAFAERVTPFLKTYCVKCHSGAKAEAELDLTKYQSSDAVGEHFRQWETVIAFLKKGEMPPEKAKQPPAEERRAVVSALEELLRTEARKVAGDPGVVLPRRLTNAEYDNTIRDLTGQDIHPTASFPVDPASGEGFTNTGEALSMSPSLFKKYYAAAQHVADHVLVTPSGLRFAPHPVVTFADQKEFYETAITDFYEQHAVRYEDYLAQAWLYRNEPAVREKNTLEDLAVANKLSPKYLRRVYELLTGNDPPDDEFYLHWLRKEFNSLPADKGGELDGRIKALANEIRKKSKAICPKETEAIVSNAGNGPVQHIARRTKTAAERDTFGGDDAAKPADTKAAARQKAAGEAFCAVFPNRFYYVDDPRGLSAGFHLIEGFFRDDQPLCKLVLSDEENRELARLWDELYFGTNISEKELRGFVYFERSERNFLKHKDFDSFKEEDPELTKPDWLNRFEQVYLARMGVKEGQPTAEHPAHLYFEAIRRGLARRREQLAAAKPIYLKQLHEFAERAYRRPLTTAELAKLEEFYESICRNPELGVEQAVRGVVTSLLVSPHFCYRVDLPPAGETVQPLSDLALASRLSYFLWSSMPDAELLAVAKAGKLRDEKVLLAQTRRMLKDERVSGFALEFFGQWLRYRDFLTEESVDRRVFPAFDDKLKHAMFEEPTRLATHLIQTNGSLNDLIYGDATMVNKRLADHYGLRYTGQADEWQHVEGLWEKDRAGVFGMAVFLTANSQPQRTSPVKRGFWVVHKLLGEHIPPPPNEVPPLPPKETETDGKTIRELLALHTTAETCNRCHRRFDPVGLAMEGFDPIGKARTKDLAGRPVDNVVRFERGSEAHGLVDFLKHLQRTRNRDLARTFCHKLLGYALGRSLELSDQDLLEKMQKTLEKDDFRFATLFETVVASPQFRTQRCRDFDLARFRAESTGKSER